MSEWDDWMRWLKLRERHKNIKRVIVICMILTKPHTLEILVNFSTVLIVKLLKHVIVLLIYIQLNEIDF